MGIQSLKTVAVINNYVISIAVTLGNDGDDFTGVGGNHRRALFVGDVQSRMVPNKELGDTAGDRPNPLTGSDDSPGVRSLTSQILAGSNRNFVGLDTVGDY